MITVYKAQRLNEDGREVTQTAHFIDRVDAVAFADNRENNVSEIDVWDAKEYKPYKAIALQAFKKLSAQERSAVIEYINTRTL